MENSLVNQIKEYISPELIAGLASSTNESEVGMNKAFDLAIPALLLKIYHKGDAYLRSMFSEVRSVFRNAGDDFDYKLHHFGVIMDDFLGNDKQQLQDEVSKHAAVSQVSSETVLRTSFLGIMDYFKKIDVDFEGAPIKNMLSVNLEPLKGLLPVGMGIPAVADTHVNEPAAAHREEREYADINEVVNHNEKDQFKTHHAPDDKKKKEGGSMFKYILIPLLLAIVLFFLLYRSCTRETVIEEVKVTQTMDTVRSQTPASADEPRQITVSEKVSLSAYAGGIEEKLVEFLKQGNYKKMTEDELKEIWFDFDRLNFATNTANVLPESQPQLENLAQILTVFPDAKIKIGGYTDKTGNEAVNKKLSEERAQAVKKFLEDKGLGKQVAGAEGYGSEFARYAADAPEDQRVTDRKVAVSVRN